MPGISQLLETRHSQVTENKQKFQAPPALSFCCGSPLVPCGPATPSFPGNGPRWPCPGRGHDVSCAMSHLKAWKWWGIRILTRPKHIEWKFDGCLMNCSQVPSLAIANFQSVLWSFLAQAPPSFWCLRAPCHTSWQQPARAGETNQFAIDSKLS